MSLLPSSIPGRPVCHFCNGTIHWDMDSATWLHDAPEITHAVVVSATQVPPAPEPDTASEESPDSYLSRMSIGCDADTDNGSYDESPIPARFQAVREIHLKLHEDSGCQLSHCPFAPCINVHCSICYPSSGGTA